MDPFILLLPLLTAILVIIFDRNLRRAKYVAIAGSVASLALLPFIDAGTSSFAWFTAGGLQMSIVVSVAPLNYMLLLVVALIGVLVFLYSFEFMSLPTEWKRYYIEMLAFEASMLAFAMAGNFILFFIAWEFLSLTSYLLIGFWHSRDRAIAAARKTVTIILIGDVCLLASMVIANLPCALTSHSAVSAGLTQNPMFV